MVATGQMVVAVILGRDLDIASPYPNGLPPSPIRLHRDLRLGARKASGMINNKRRFQQRTGHRRRRGPERLLRPSCHGGPRWRSISGSTSATFKSVACIRHVDGRDGRGQWKSTGQVERRSLGGHAHAPDADLVGLDALFPDLQPRGTAAVGVDRGGRSRRSTWRHGRRSRVAGQHAAAASATTRFARNCAVSSTLRHVRLYVATYLLRNS